MTSLFGGGFSDFGGLPPQNMMPPPPWAEDIQTAKEKKKTLTDEEKKEVLSKIQPIPSTFQNNPAALSMSQELISGAPISVFEIQDNSDEEEKKGSGGEDNFESKDVQPTLNADSMSVLRFVAVDNPSQDVEISPSGKILKSAFLYILKLAL